MEKKSAAIQSVSIGFQGYVQWKIFNPLDTSWRLYCKWNKISLEIELVLGLNMEYGLRKRGEGWVERQI